MDLLFNRNLNMERNKSIVIPAEGIAYAKHQIETTDISKKDLNTGIEILNNVANCLENIR